MRGYLRASACLVSLMGGLTLHSQAPDALHAMYETHQVFALRDAVGHTTAPLFYRAAVEVSSNDLRSAERDLRSFIDAAPHSEEAFQSHDLLGNMYFRNGRYKEALREIVVASSLKPDDGDVKSMLPILTVLGKLPGQIVVGGKPTKLQIERGSVFVPLKIDGKDAEYFFDTGSPISVLGKSEADRLGLRTATVGGGIGDSSGTGVTGVRVAMAGDVVIGGLHLKNVPFIVLSDTGEPWIHMPQNRRGIIGLPILLAMQTVRWRSTGSFEFAFPGHDLDLRASNMLFYNSNPVIKVTVEGKQLCFTLDTGAVGTDVNPPFATALPELMKTGKPETQAIEGLGGSNNYDSVLLQSVTFEIAGKKLALAPTHVFTKHGNGSWAAGNLGMDLLGKARSFTLDFKAMTLTLD